MKIIKKLNWGFIMAIIGIIFLSLSSMEPLPFINYIHFNLFLWIGIPLTIMGIIIDSKIIVDFFKPK